MEWLIRVLVEIVELDYALSSSLCYLYNIKPDWFTEESLLAIVDKGKFTHNDWRELDKLTGERFHGRIVRNIVDDCSELENYYIWTSFNNFFTWIKISNCDIGTSLNYFIKTQYPRVEAWFAMLDKRCDQYTYTKLLDHFIHYDYYVYQDWVKLRFREMKEMGYKRELMHFDIIVRREIDNNSFEAARELLGDMINEHPGESVQVKEFFMLVHMRAPDLASACLAILEARANGIGLYANVDKCRTFTGFTANRDVLFEVLAKPSDAYQLLLLDQGVDLQGVLLLVREAKSTGLLVNPVEALDRCLPRYWGISKKDAVALDILKEADLLNDAALAGLSSNVDRDKILKLALRDGRLSAFPESVEGALLHHQVRVPVWLSKALAKSNATQEDVLRSLRRGHVATALQLLNKKCDEKTFEAIFKEARVLIKRIASKKDTLRSLGYKLLKQ